MENRVLSPVLLPQEACKMNHYTGNQLFPFVCGLCNLAFRNLHCFYTHFHVHHELLGGTFYHLCQFDHVVTRHDSDQETGNSSLNILSCDDCSQTFGTVCAAHKHLVECHKTKMYLVDLERCIVFPNLQTSRGNSMGHENNPVHDKLTDFQNRSVNISGTLNIDSRDMTTLETPDTSTQYDGDLINNDEENTKMHSNNDCEKPDSIILENLINAQTEKQDGRVSGKGYNGESEKDNNRVSERHVDECSEVEDSGVARVEDSGVLEKPVNKAEVSEGGIEDHCSNGSERLVTRSSEKQNNKDDEIQSTRKSSAQDGGNDEIQKMEDSWTEIQTDKEHQAASKDDNVACKSNAGDCFEVDGWTVQFYDTESDTEAGSTDEPTLSQEVEEPGLQDLLQGEKSDTIHESGVSEDVDKASVSDEVTIHTILQDIEQSQFSDDAENTESDRHEDIVSLDDKVEKIVEGSSKDKNQPNIGSRAQSSQTPICKSRRKPHRPCPFCFCDRSALTKHLKKKHSDEHEVKYAMSLPTQERNRAFLLLKRKGIMHKNMEIMRSTVENKDQLILERKRHSGKKENVIYCSKCFGFFKKAVFYRHRRTCHMNECSTNVPIAVIPQETFDKDRNDERHEAFVAEILGSFLSDSVGNICKKDKIIVGFGKQKFYKLLKRKKDAKYDDKKATIRTEMRRLGNLYLKFMDVCDQNLVECESTMDMVKRSNFNLLQEAIVNITLEDNGSVKDTLRKELGYLIKKLCTFLHGMLSVQNEDKLVCELDRFVDVLNYFWPEMFGESEYAPGLKRQTRLRKPHYLPEKEEVKKLRDFTVGKLNEMTSDKYQFVPSSDYSLLRDLVVSRLTLFNARRGGEPSCLLLDQWNDAEKDSRFRNKHAIIDPLEKALVGRFKIAYQPGKGGKLVPLLVIEDCWTPLKILCDADIRKQAGIHTENDYVFPMTRYSTKHVSGWKCVSEICSVAKLQKNISATSMRHYVATVYAALEVPESERETFYAHTGHSADINGHVYQSPLARQEVTRVGKPLEEVDMGTHPSLSGTNKHTYSKNEAVGNDYQEIEQVENDVGRRVTRNRNKGKHPSSSGTNKNTHTNNEVICDLENDNQEIEQVENDVGKRVTRKRNKERHFLRTRRASYEDYSHDDLYDEDSVTDPDFKVGTDDLSTDDETTDTEVDQEVNKEGTPTKKKRQYELWREEDSSAIKEYFKKYIYSAEKLHANSGSLPSVNELETFLTEHPSIKADLPKKDRIYRLRSKIFNERKLVREKLRKYKGNASRKQKRRSRSLKENV